MSEEPTAGPIVVIDDDENDLLLFTRRLSEQPLVFRARAAAMKQLTWIARRSVALPRACFIEPKMTGSDGFATLSEIRGMKQLSRMPVIMLANWDHPDDVAKAQRLGAQGFFQKFPSAEDLQRVLNDATLFGLGPTATALFAVAGNLLLHAADGWT